MQRPISPPRRTAPFHGSSPLGAAACRGISALALAAVLAGPLSAGSAWAQASAGADSSIVTGAGMSAVPVWGGRPNEDGTPGTKIYFADPAGDPRALWLQGEEPTRLMSFYLPSPGITSARLQLSLRNGSDVLPPDLDKGVLGSRIQVQVNGREVAVIPSVPHTQNQKLVFDIPAEYFQVGENKILFSADHRHRLYCSIQSTFDLWSEINPRDSFIAVTPVENNSFPTLSRLTELLQSSYSAEEPLLMLRAEGNITGQTVEQGSLIAQAYGLRVGHQAPLVESRLAPRGGNGESSRFPQLDVAQIDSSKVVLYGTADAIASYSPDIANRVTGPFLGIYELKPDDQRTVIVVSGRNEAEVRRAALELQDPGKVLPGTEDAVLTQDLPALPPAPPSEIKPVGPHSTFKLSDLGMQNVQFDGVRRVDKIAFSLPSDYYPGQDAPVTLHLSGSYSNIGPDGQILVRLNDEFQNPDDPNVVSAIPLEEDGTHELVNREVQIQAAAFQPGINILTIEAQLPPHNAKDCTGIRDSDAAGGGGGGGALRYTLDAASTIAFPDFVAQARMPDLATTGTTGFPLTRGQRLDPPLEPQLYVPNPSDNTLSGTYMLTARLAQSAHQVVPYFGTTARPTDDADVLVVGPRSALDETTFQGAPVAWGDLGAAFARLPPTLLNPVRSRPAPEAAVADASGTAPAPTAQQANGEALRAQEDFINALTRAGGGQPSAQDEAARQARAQADEQARANERAQARQVEIDDRSRAAERAKEAEASASATRQSRENPTLITRLFRRTKAFLLGERPQGTEDLPVGGNPLEGKPGQTSVMMQYRGPKHSNSTWTVFTSASDAVLPVDAQRLTSANYWGRLRGDAMAFGGAPGSISRRAPSDTYVVRAGSFKAQEVAETFIGSAFGPSRFEWFFYMALAVFGFAFVTWAATRVLGQNQGRSDLKS